MTQLSGYLAVICSSFLFGAGTMIIKFSYQSGLSPATVLVAQIGIAMLMSWIITIMRHKKCVIPRELWGAMILQGTVASALNSVLFFYALDELGASLATLLLFTFPALITLYHGLWCRIPIRRFQQIALVLAFGGLLCTLDVFHASVADVSGAAMLIGLGAAVTNAFCSINGEKLLNIVDTFVVMAWTYTFSFFTLLCLYRPEWLFHMNFSNAQSLLLISGAVFNFAPLVCYFFALPRIGSGIASIVSTLEIPIALLFAYVLLGETMNGIQITGGIFITASVFLLYYESWKRYE